eukprot:TRINITY_DN12611_c0_g1_i1.p1 TRINITY_DN12611_c0_g1~~TRINITY_DN12611_c0_g1_i1.p1  ORF type:complete len:287 (+),score=42.29 TRINITY_DN12611_c0_g1_i1:87-947(+)
MQRPAQEVRSGPISPLADQQGSSKDMSENELGYESAPTTPPFQGAPEDALATAWSPTAADAGPTCSAGCLPPGGGDGEEGGSADTDGLPLRDGSADSGMDNARLQHKLDRHRSHSCALDAASAAAAAVEQGADAAGLHAAQQVSPPPSSQPTPAVAVADVTRDWAVVLQLIRSALARLAAAELLQLEELRVVQVHAILAVAAVYLLSTPAAKLEALAEDRALRAPVVSPSTTVVPEHDPELRIPAAGLGPPQLPPPALPPPRQAAADPTAALRAYYANHTAGTPPH